MRFDCPTEHCGGTAESGICCTRIRMNGGFPWAVHCHTCGVRTDYYGTEEEAVQAWKEHRFVTIDYLKQKEREWADQHLQQMELFEND